MAKSWEGFRIGGLLLKRLLNVIAVVEFFDETVVDKVFRFDALRSGIFLSRNRAAKAATRWIPTVRSLFS